MLLREGLGRPNRGLTRCVIGGFDSIRRGQR
jgi:hypothetical protein